MTAAPHLSIIPRPLSVAAGPSGGSGAVLADGLVIAYPPELAREARWFRRVLEAGTGWVVSIAGTAGDTSSGAQKNNTSGGLGKRPEDIAPDESPTVELRLGALTDLADDLAALVPEATRHEAYRLTTSAGKVVVTAPSGAGVFYGLQTLRQLLPDSVFRAAPLAGPLGPIALADLEIIDAPRLAWRGVHLDVCRHFMPKAFVLRLIDLISVHKCNVFHLHLTEDQGWRIPIERYQRLTEVGAWRAESSAGHYHEGRFDGTPHGGYYTREDLEEIVAFAAERHVNVLPEIEMPGHMVAAIAAYPELGNTERQLHVRTNWGISKHVLNLDDATLQFCTDDIDEVVEIFPWANFHVGGDECPTIEWETSPRAQELMGENGFTEERQLQGWFTARMAQHLASRGRTLVGWDEILEGGLAPGATVASWRGMTGAVTAARRGHDVVACPDDGVYLDYRQSDSADEPIPVSIVLTVADVYDFEPIAAELTKDEARHVLGGQANIWTEYMDSPRVVDFFAFPRLCALAEALWSTGERDFDDFAGRLEQHLARLDALGVEYRRPSGPLPWQQRPGIQGRPSTREQRAASVARMVANIGG